jgi:hypothetical protein
MRDEGKVLSFEFCTTPYSLLPTPYSLLPTPYSLLPTPYSLLPTPYSLLPLLNAFFTQYRYCSLGNCKDGMA